MLFSDRVSAVSVVGVFDRVGAIDAVDGFDRVGAIHAVDGFEFVGVVDTLSLLLMFPMQILIDVGAI